MKQILLDNIRSAHNVGSIFRTADGSGVEKIYLRGYTPLPIDRFGRKQPEITKTSLGASEVIPWEHIEDEDIKTVLHRLRTEGFQIVSVEQDPRSVSFYDFKSTDKVCYIFGNEIEGVSQELLKESDTIIEIPMAGTKESLNVSVTAGVVLFSGG